MDSPSCNQHDFSGDYKPTIRVVASAMDPFHGLKGHDYIKARNLNPPVQRVQTSAHLELAATRDGK